MTEGVPSRTRRKNAWWEPTYDPTLVDEFTAGDWRLPDNAAHKRYFHSGSFLDQVKDRKTNRKFSSINFDTCDFSGRYEGEIAGANFNECTFKNCDFGTSTWERVKFRKCNFEQCSFTQSTWVDVEFRKCKWNDIGISGNETDLNEVFIENPSDFIGSAYTNLDEEVLAAKGRTPEFQLFKLEQTKATVARSIFNNHKVVGDDQAFYRAFSAYMTQYSASRISDADWYSKQVSGCAHYRWRLIKGHRYSEHLLNQFFGFITGWGSSSLKPLIGLFATFVAFTLVYWLIFSKEIHEAASISFDVTSIAAFTRSIDSDVGGGLYVASAINLVISLLFYSAFFSVAISKISRTR